MNLGHVDREEVIMARSNSAEFRRKVLDLVEAGRPAAEIAEHLGVTGPRCSCVSRHHMALTSLVCSDLGK